MYMKTSIELLLLDRVRKAKAQDRAERAVRTQASQVLCGHACVSWSGWCGARIRNLVRKVSVNPFELQQLASKLYTARIVRRA